MPWKSLLSVALLGSLCGCGQYWETHTAASTALGPGTQVLVATADQRLVSSRPDPQGRPNGIATADGKQLVRQIVCTEPSPDVAKALDTALQLSASASAPNGPQGQGSLSYSTAETISMLAGRTASVVAMRDVLFRACEAYANGILGRNGYALIMSQYGEVLKAIMLGEAAATAGQTAQNSSASTDKSSGSKDSGSGGGSTTSATPIAVAVNSPASSPSSPTAKPGTDPSTPSSNTGGKAAPPTAPAGAISNIAEFALDPLPGTTLGSALVVSCLAANDPTTDVPTPANSLLTSGNCKTWIDGYLTQSATLAQAVLKAKYQTDANPKQTGAGSAGAGPPAAKPVGAAKGALTPVQVAHYQTILQKLNPPLYNCPDVCKVDGLPGENTTEAVKQYQSKKPDLKTKNGTLDASTMEALDAEL